MVTNDVGEYTAYSFPTGRITVSVAQTGFQRLVRSGIVLTSVLISAGRRPSGPPPSSRVRRGVHRWRRTCYFVVSACVGRRSVDPVAFRAAQPLQLAAGPPADWPAAARSVDNHNDTFGRRLRWA